MFTRSSIIDNQFVLGDPNGFPKIDSYVLPDEAERKRLVEECKLDPHLVESALDPNETPRIEFEGDYTAIILKYPQVHNKEGNAFPFRVESLGYFLLRSGNAIAIYSEVLKPTYSHGSLDGTFLKHIKTSQDVFLSILNQTIRHFEFRLKTIANQKNELTKSILKFPKEQNLKDLFTIREGLVYYIDALRGNGHMIERLLRVSERLEFTPRNKELLEDFAIENLQFLEQAQVYSQVLTELMDFCDSLLNNNLNSTMKKMNFLVIAVSIPAFFTGFFGMSEFTTFAAPYLKWYFAYPLFLLLMVFLSVIVYHLFKRFFK